jgi:hypothetical protein
MTQRGRIRVNMTYGELCIYKFRLYSVQADEGPEAHLTGSQTRARYDNIFPKHDNEKWFLR